MTSPHGNLKYVGKGQFLIRNDISKKFNKIGMICGGTGITPMFQLIQKIIATRGDKTGLSLIYCTKFIEEMAFCEDLVKYDRSGLLTFYPVVETAESSKWSYGKGWVSEEMINDYMPSPKGNLSIKKKIQKQLYSYVDLGR